VLAQTGVERQFDKIKVNGWVVKGYVIGENLVLKAEKYENNENEKHNINSHSNSNNPAH
jgi:hypothetical protein